MKKAIIVSGYFNPLHVGHIEYFKNAKQKADELIVIVNNDLQRKLKGSKEFMSEKERILIIENLKLVDKAYLSIDNDKTVNNTIKNIYNELGHKYDLMFGNGGDQDNSSIPETKMCESLGIKLVDGLGTKIQSSSWLLNKQK
tara:strand:+ start:1185 stop:1610 length:426 start_codon:yes stop_codon:yes gene_type:complete